MTSCARVYHDVMCSCAVTCNLMLGQFRSHVAIDMCDIKNVIVVKKRPPDTEEERPEFNC